MLENRPHPGVAAVLSFVFNGLGQIYNGQIKKGFFLIFLSTISMLLMITGGVLAIIYLSKALVISRPLVVSLIVFLLGIIFAAAIGIFSIFDAYNTARKLNQ